MKARLLDISKWSEKLNKQTEGTRDKRVLISPDDGAVYYFKTSIKKQKQDYKMEFWSEVIASRIGQYLGFEVAQYDVAILHEEEDVFVGCLSKSIYNQDEEQMLSGYNLMVAYDESFRYNYKQDGYHSLELIRKTLQHHDIEHLFQGLVHCWLFDMLIGNGDRHSENWAVIRSKSTELLEEQLSKVSDSIDTLQDRDAKDIFGLLYRFIELLVKRNYRIGQIYDSGSSLGRELSEERVKQMLCDKKMFDAYLLRAKGDISIRHTEKRKTLEDFALLTADYYDLVSERIVQIGEQVLRVPQELRGIVHGIDEDIREHIPEEYRLSPERKELIYRLVYERIKRMIEL